MDAEGARRMVRLALLASLGACLHWLEGFFPPLPVPGARLGLANLVTLVALFAGGPLEAVVTAALRSLLGSLLGGKFLGLGFAMSLTGAVLSAVVMSACAALSRLRQIAPVSMVGGVIHNLAQASVAYAAIGVGIIPYLPPLVALGLLAGWVTGNLARPVVAALGPAGILRPFPLAAGWPRLRLSARSSAKRWVAIAALTVLVSFLAVPYVTAGHDQRVLVVELRSREIARLPLERGAPPRFLRVELPGTGAQATIEVAGGRAHILPLPGDICPRGICSHTGWIEKPGQAAICLPNRLVIRVVEVNPGDSP